jgi:hypothetical protein
MRAHPSSLYLQLAEGHDDVYEGASRLRRALVLAAAVALLVVSLLFAASSPGSDLVPWKVDDAMARDGDGSNGDPPGGDDDDEDDDDTTEGREDDDDDTDATDSEEDTGTGRESQANNTDAGNVNDSGLSTRGETDPGDHTGQTERR